MNRRALLTSLAAVPLLGTRIARARDSGAPHRMGGLLMSTPEKAMSELVPPFMKALADIGYVEGRNLATEWRFYAFDMVRGASMAAELVRLAPEVLMTHGTPPTKLLQHATKTIPIITSVQDPVASGFARSLGRPEGNITGFCHVHPDAETKQVELLRSMVPGLDRIVYIDDIGYGGAREGARPFERAVKAAGLKSEVRLVARPEVEQVFVDMKRSGGTSAAFVLFVTLQRAEMARFALRHRVPTMGSEPDYVERGGLMSFGMYHGSPQRFFLMIDKILKGMKPADIPWELPDRTQLAINLGTAKALGLTISQDLLLRADQVVE
jgi:ABC-type uncharacterized transport system substrate-binding protein